MVWKSEVASADGLSQEIETDAVFRIKQLGHDVRLRAVWQLAYKKG